MINLNCRSFLVVNLDQSAKNVVNCCRVKGFLLSLLRNKSFSVWR